MGVTEAQAKERFGDDSVETYNYNLGGNGRSKILGTQGFVKLVRQKDGPVVGVHMIGARVGVVGDGELHCPLELAQRLRDRHDRSVARTAGG